MITASFPLLFRAAGGIDPLVFALSRCNFAEGQISMIARGALRSLINLSAVDSMCCWDVLE